MTNVPKSGLPPGIDYTKLPADQLEKALYRNRGSRDEADMPPVEKGLINEFAGRTRNALAGTDVTDDDGATGIIDNAAELSDK